MTIGRSIYSAYESRLLGTIIINVNVRDLQELWPEPDQNFQENFTWWMMKIEWCSVIHQRKSADSFL